MSLGLQEIYWFTKEEKAVYDAFEKLVGAGGFATRNYRQSQLFSYLWITDAVLMCAFLLFSTLHFVDLEMIAYCFHHSVLMFDDFVIVYVFWVNREGIMSCMKLTTWTYNYNSPIVENYAKNLIRGRTELLRLIKNVIVVCSVIIIVEVQVFFILEITHFQTYQTIYPVYLGLDMNNWAVYLFTIVWQESTVFLTTILGVAPCSFAFAVWSHLTVECRILKFAIEHVKEIVEEQTRKESGESDVDMKNEFYKLYCYHFAKHHASILQYFRQFKKTMAWTTMLVFTTGFIIMVAVGFTLFSDNTSVKLKLFGFLIAQFFVIYGWCWVGQNICDHGEEISEAIVSANWWLMPKSCATTLHLIMVGCNIPLALTTPFGQMANNECCKDMLTGAYQMVNVIYQATRR